jgi:hypothetical protein
MSEAPCLWPHGTCACYAQEAVKPDYAGRVWMHCDEGLNLSKSSMSRFIMFCLTNRVEIGSVHPFNPAFPRSHVSAAVRIHPDLIEAFEVETGGKLREPPRLSLNASTPEQFIEEPKP